MAKREVYLTSVKTRLSEWSVRLDELRAKATGEVSSAYHKQLDAWKATGNSIAEKLGELRSLDEKWYVIRSEVEKGLRTIESAIGGTKAEKPKAATGSDPPAVTAAAPEKAEPPAAATAETKTQKSA